MKLTEFLSDVGRPVAYYPGLRRITGSTTATILLCQLIYWTGKESKGDGWIYKSVEELETETGLSYEEQRTAREKLVSAGIIKEDYKRLEHRMYFQVQTDAINDKWEIPEMGNPQMGNKEIPISSNKGIPSSLISNTETTTKTTTQIDIVSDELKLQGFMMTPRLVDYLKSWREHHADEWIVAALKKTKGRNPTYTDAILLGWESEGYPKSREQQIQERKNASANYPTNKKPVIEQSQPTDADRALAAQIRAARGLPALPGD